MTSIRVWMSKERAQDLVDVLQRYIAKSENDAATVIEYHDDTLVEVGLDDNDYALMYVQIDRPGEGDE